MRRLTGLGQTTYPDLIQVTDPSVIAMLKQTAISNNIDPSLVDQAIANGDDAVQIQLAMSRAPNGPAQLLAQTQTTDELVDQNQILQNQITGTDTSTPYSVAPIPSSSGIPSWVWWAGGGLLAVIVLKDLL
jgi:hypothetical protein